MSLTRDEVEIAILELQPNEPRPEQAQAIQALWSTDAALRQQLFDEQSLHQATKLCLTAQTESVLKCAEKVATLTAKVEAVEALSVIDKQANDEYRDIRAANLAVIHTLTAKVDELEQVYQWLREGWVSGWLTYTGYSEFERYEQWMNEKPKSLD